MQDNAYPFAIGAAVDGSSGQFDGILGTLWFTNDGKAYRLCKLTTELALAASRCVVTAYSAGVPTWKCDLAGAVTSEDVVVIPSTQTGSGSTSTTLLADDYFWGQVSGACSFISANTTLVYVAGQTVLANSLGGVAALAAVTTASTVTYRQGNLRVTNTVASTNTVAAGAITGMISGLI
jgi:hypothetical protein